MKKSTKDCITEIAKAVIEIAAACLLAWPTIAKCFKRKKRSGS